MNLLFALHRRVVSTGLLVLLLVLLLIWLLAISEGDEIRQADAAFIQELCSRQSFVRAF